MTGQARHLNVETGGDHRFGNRPDRRRVPGEPVQHQDTGRRPGGVGERLSTGHQGRFNCHVSSLPDGRPPSDASSHLISRTVAATSTTRGGRRIEGSALSALAPLAVLAPFCLLTLIAIGRLINAMLASAQITGRWWWYPLGWLVAGVCLFWRPVQIAVLSPALGARRPTASELEALNPVWESVTRAAGVDPAKYVLRVIDADEINAFANGGHLVIVTSYAATELTPTELSGVLAHELSHHLGLHTVALTFGHWLSIPVLALARVGFRLQNVASAATSAFASHSAALTALGKVVAAALTAISWIPLSVVHLSDAVGNLVGHRAEFEADRRVVHLGFGPSMVAALRKLIAAGGGARAIGWRQRLAASHPPARTRIARIEAMLRHPTGRPG